MSDNKILSFFELTPSRSGIVNSQILFNSFYPWEGDPGKFRWAGEGANIVLYNNNDIVFLAFC